MIANGMSAPRYQRGGAGGLTLRGLLTMGAFYTRAKSLPGRGHDFASAVLLGKAAVLYALRR